jgi:hypothetical protein
MSLVYKNKHTDQKKILSHSKKREDGNLLVY